MKNRSILCLPLAIALVFPPVAKSDPVHLDLSSSEANLSAQSLISSGQSSVQITQDGKSVTIGSSDMVTPAQLVAVGQALSGGQTINLNAAGVAVGGSFTLTNNLAQSLSGLNVPSGVTAIQDFASSGLNLAGNFSNYGTFYAVSSSTNVTTAVIQASNIFNQPGALLTSVLPAGGLPGYSNLVANLNLALIASNNIVNYGSITSSAGLSATAGGSISNFASAGSMPVMQALNDIVMQAATISNAGSILSQTGAVNIATANLNNQSLIQSVMQGVNIETRLGDQVLNVLNNNGVISSLKELSLSANQDLLVEGGQLNGESIKLSAPAGWVLATDVDLVGPLDVCASDAHILASGALTLRSFNVTGDPIISSGLSQSFSGVSNYSDSLLVVAKQDILGSGGDIISTNGDIHMFAGADWAPVGGGVEVNPTGLTGNIIMGNISGTANIVLGAFNGSITTGDVSTTNGSVIMLAPGGITSNNISASKAVTARTADPVFLSANSNKLTFDSTGALQDGVVKTTGTIQSGNVIVSNVTSGSYVELLAGGFVTALGPLTATGVAIQVGDSKPATINGMINASGSVLVTSPGALVLANNLNVNSPVLYLNSATGPASISVMGNITNSAPTGDIRFQTPQIKFGGSNQITTAGIIDVDGPAGPGVTIKVLSGNTGVMTANSVRVGPTAGGGSVQLTGSGTLQLITTSAQPDASRIEATGSGGNITFDANLVTSGNLLLKTNGVTSQIVNDKLVDAGGSLQVQTRFLRLSPFSTMQGRGVKVNNSGDVDITGPGTGKTATLQSVGAGNILSIFPTVGIKNINFGGSGTLILDSDTQIVIGSTAIPTNNIVVSPTIVINGAKAAMVSATTAVTGSYFQNGGQVTYNSGQLLIDTPTVKLGANSLLRASTVEVKTNNPLQIQAPSSNSATIESLVGSTAFQGSTGIQFFTMTGTGTVNIISQTPTFTTAFGDIVVGPNTTLNLTGPPGSAIFSANNGTIEVAGKIDTPNSLFLNSIAVALQNSSYIHAATVNAVGTGASYFINLQAGNSTIDTTGFLKFQSGSAPLTVQRSTGSAEAVLSLTGSSLSREFNGVGATIGNNVRIISDTNLTVNSLGIGGDTTVLGTLEASGNIVASSSLGKVDFQGGKATAGGDVTLSTFGLAGGSIANSGDIVSLTGNIFINTAGFDFDHTGGKLDAAGSITALVGGGDIDIGADVTASSISFTANNINHSNGSINAPGTILFSALGGDITQSVSAPAVQGGAITLSALSGSVGLSNPFKTMTPDLTISANASSVDNIGNAKLNYFGGTGGSSFYNDGNLTIETAYALGGGMSFSANGNINTSNLISAPGDISLLSTATNGSIQIGDGTAIDDIFTSGIVTLTATGTGTINTDGVASLNAGQLYLNSDTGAIGTLDVNAPCINVTSAGAVNIDNVALSSTLNGTVGSLVYTGDNVDVGTLTAPGDLTIGVTGTLQVATAASGAKVSLTGGVIDGTGIAATSSLIIDGSTVLLNNVSTPDIKLNAAGDVSIIETGIGVTKVHGSANKLDLTSGDALTVSSALTITGVFRGATLIANGTIDVAAPISADLIDLSTTAVSSGDILINSPFTANISATLTANGSGSIIRGGAVSNIISAMVVGLGTNTGDIGSGLLPIITAAGTIQVIGGNNVHLSESDSVQLTSSTATDFNLFANGDISTSGGAPALNAQSVTITTPAGLTVSQDLTGSNIMTLTADNIVDIGGKLISGNLILNANSVGSPVNRVHTDAGNLTLVRASADVYLDNAGSVNLKPSTANILDIKAQGNIVIGGNSSVSGLLKLHSVSASILNPSSALLSAPIGTIDLHALTDIGTGTQPVRTEAAFLIAKSDFGSVFLSEKDGVTISSSSARISFNLSAGGVLRTSGLTPAIDAYDINLSTTSGAIYIDRDLTAANQITLQSASDVIESGGRLIAQQVSLFTPGGAIGASGQAIQTSAYKLLADASGDVFLQNSGDVTVLSSRAGAKYDLQNTGKVFIANGIQAVDTSIATIGNNDIIISTGSPLASSSLTLSVQGVGSISTGTPMAAVPALYLFTSFGDIGSAGNPLDVTASTLTANSTGGNVYILDRQSVQLGSSSAGSIGTFQLIAPGITTTGNLNAHNILLETPLLNNDFLLRATGTMSVLSTTGSLLVQGNGTLSSAGPITFSSSGSVTVTQSGIQDLSGGPGLVAGNAPGFFSVTSGSGFNAANITSGAGVKLTALSGNLIASLITSGGTLDLSTLAGSLTASALISSGNMSLTTTGGDLTVTGKLDANGGTILLSSGNGLTLNAPIINSTGVLSLTANNDISINGGILSAGSINALNKLSTNMSDFDYSAILTKGGVSIRSTSGKISTGAVQIISYGDSISFAAPGSINIGPMSSFFAQGGNITINSWTDDVTIGGFSTFQAVARSIVPSTPLIIDGQQINQFVGGDIGIDVDMNVAAQYVSYDNYLRTFDLNRVVNGNVPNGTLNVVGANINNMSGTTMNITNSGMVDVRTTGTATAIGSITFGSGTKLNTDGGVIQIDPINSDILIGPGVAFNAFGPNLLGGGVFVVPPAPPAGNNNAAVPPPIPPLFALLPGIIGGIIGGGGGGAGGGGGGGGAVAGPGAGGPVTPVDVVNPVAQVPVVAPAPPPAIQTDVIVLSANEEKQQEKKETTFATRSTEVDYFVPITYVGTAPCQQFLIAGKRRGDLQCVTVVASRGTVLGTVKSPEEKQSFASRLLSLKEGKIVVVSGQKSGMKLDVSDATLNLPVGSVAVVHRKASGAMRVSMVSGGTVSVAIKGAGGDQVMTAAPGEEIAIGGSEEELIAADGIERQLISAKMIMTVDGDDARSDEMLKGGVSTSAIGTTTASNLKPGKRNLRVEKRSFDREKMSEGENLLACLDCAKIGCSSSMCRLQRSHFTQPKTKTRKLTASSQKQLDEVRDAHVFSPVAYKISLQPPTAAPMLSTLQLGTAVVKHAGAANITSTEKNVITANQGEVLVCSSKPTVVKAGNALVECSPGSLMLINTTPRSVSVSSLWQDGAVTVHAGTRNYKMRPGEECIITGSNQTQKAMQANAAARRNVRSFSVGSSQSMSVSEVSLASVFLTSPVLQQLRRSQESVDKNMANRIAKMYAVLNIVTGRRGPYSYSQQ